MKNSTYKWVIGCLIGVIVILITFLVLKEADVIAISFSESLSLASTICSLILSVIAMLYTYYSGRDAQEIYSKIQETIKDVDAQVLMVSKETQRNSQTLERITEGIQNNMALFDSLSDAKNSMKKKDVSVTEREEAVKAIEKTQNSMMMFLKRMQEKE